MAASGEETALGELGQEAICQLCLDFLEQPMVLSCGHNFCCGCLAQLGTEASCPQCRAKVEPGSACPNRALANIVRHLKRLRLSGGAQEEGSGHRLCQEHRQPLQSFCSHEKSLLCPGCLGGHQGHPLLSLPKAAQKYKDLLDGLLEPLRKEGQKLQEQRQAEEQSRQKCQEQFAAEKQEVGLALESLQELLREKQPVWVAWLAEQEEKTEAEWVGPLAQLSGEASRLQQLLAQTAKKCRQPDEEFLQDIQDTVDRCQSYVVGNVGSTAPTLRERAKTLLEKSASIRQSVGNCKASLQRNLSRENLERPLAAEEPLGTGFFCLGETLEDFQDSLWGRRRSLEPDQPWPYQAPAAEEAHSSKVFITPDGSTAHPRLQCQGLRMTWTQRYQDFPETPERFDRELCVLGCEGFTTGWHWWEVYVQEADDEPVWERTRWAIGVAKESVRRKGAFQLSPQEGVWALGKSFAGEVVAFSQVEQKVSLGRPLLRRLRVRLGYEAKRVEFLDAETEVALHTFQTGPFLGETLRPFFFLGQDGVALHCEKYLPP